LGFEPDALQEEILRLRSKRLLLNRSRQWGKSSVCAIAALYRAWYRPGSLVVVTGPSGRQAGEFVDKVREFGSRLDISSSESRVASGEKSGQWPVASGQLGD
jgi:hypothetical protein